MASALAFDLPTQTEGIEDGGAGVRWSHVYALAADANGLAPWSRQKKYTGFTHDTEYLQILRNRGSGGRHLWVQKSTDGSTVLQVLDAGLTTPVAITSTVATGTAPFVVASTTLVANLNAALINGAAGPFLTQATADLRYLQLTGGTISGDLTVQGAFAADSNVTLGNAAGDTVTISGNTTIQQGLTVQQSATVNGNLDVDGSLVVGSTTGLSATLGDWVLSLDNDDLVFKDDGGGEKFRVGDASSAFAAKVTGPMHVSGDIELEGAINHDGNTIGFFSSTPNAKETVTGSRGGNAALNSLLSALANYGLITNSTSA